jgi:hypothetical protein
MIVMTEQKQDKPRLGDGIPHPGARPMRVFLDKEGCMWLCDKGVDPNKGFEQQGCWRCKDMAFTRSD